MLRQSPEKTSPAEDAVLSLAAFSSLIRVIGELGYDIVAPVYRNGAVTLARIDPETQFGADWRDSQGPGFYRVTKHPDGGLFSCANGPRTPKDFLRPSTLKLFESCHTPEGLACSEIREFHVRPVAFIGVRGCDIAAIRKLSDVLAGQRYTDIDFCVRLERMLIVAVECTHPAATCFCTSTGGDPRPATGYDLLLTELTEGSHRFLVTVGTPTGGELLERIPHPPPTADDIQAASRIRLAAAQGISRMLDPAAVRKALLAAIDDDCWNTIASRCFACGNCTQVCPTCFCFTVEDSSDLGGVHCERWRKSDSCFTSAFSYIHGGSVRASVASRYRQWVMHKFVYWVDQFGSIGCTGCGRCITWCPAAIDVTEELGAICARGTTGGT